MKGFDSGKVPICDVAPSEATIEIKLKTIDSKTYTLKVDKQVPVPALKEQIETVTGVLSAQQRLICRGKVLKDDQLLSAYHVEDGHTLHLVVRQPLSDGFPISPGNEPPSAPRGRPGPSMVIETFSMPDQGEGMSPDISRIVSAVLGSFGLPNIGNSFEVVDSTRDRGMQTEHVVSDQTQLPTTLAFDPTNPPTMTDSLTTMSRYLTHLRREFSTSTSRDETNASDASPPERVPSPAYLADVLFKCRELLTNEVQDCLSQLGRNLENHATVAEASARLSTQSNALRSGFQLYNLGALLLELGRTVMTLRLGQTPAEAVVNAGPAVFINSSSPNPLMVQPLPLTNTSANAGSLPRRIDIQIRRGSSASENRGEEGEEQPNVRVVPIRTMVAALPSNSMGVYYPLMGQYQREGNTAPSSGVEGDARGSESAMEELGLGGRERERSNDRDSSTIFQLMRNLFAGGEDSADGDDVEPSSSRRGEEEEAGEGDGEDGERMILCDFLHQIMPMVTENNGAAEDGDSINNNHVSRDSSTQTESASDPETPNAKRRKSE